MIAQGTATNILGCKLLHTGMIKCRIERQYFKDDIIPNLVQIAPDGAYNVRYTCVVVENFQYTRKYITAGMYHSKGARDKNRCSWPTHNSRDALLGLPHFRKTKKHVSTRQSWKLNGSYHCQTIISSGIFSSFFFNIMKYVKCSSTSLSFFTK